MAADAFSRKFRIDRVIGAGGMGVVIVAQHLALDKRVAIKIMRPELRVRGDLVRRFLREARAAARLRSRHIAHVFDVGTLEDGAPYIVMEYLDGSDLAAWTREHGPAPVPLAAAMLSQACDAIAEAHASGIVHRDLKPANLFVTRDGDGGSLVKVLDLGICKLVEQTDELQDTGALAATLGTPAYMAPEQLGAAQCVDARSDIWSLGVILYELVTGRLPFRAQTTDELRARASRDPAPPIDRADVPSDFEAIVARCLAKEPASRFQAATELVAALAPFAAGAHPVTAASIPRASVLWRRRLWTWSLVIVAALAIAGVSMLWSPRPDDSVAAAIRIESPRPVESSSQPAPPSLPSPAPAPQRGDLEPSHEPALPAPLRPKRTNPGPRTPRTLDHSIDPLSTPY